MNTLKINRMNDFYFKYLLGSEQRKHLTIQFLNDVLYENEETQIEDVVFLDKDQDPDFEHEKLSKLDILAQTNRGTQIDIEVQVLKHSYLSERFLYYWAGLYGSQLKEKEQYTQLKPTISIILLDFDYLPETAWHNIYHICNDLSKQRLTDHFAMHFIEIKKFTYSDIKKLTKLGTWAAYFSNCDEKEMEVLTMSNTVMKDVAKAENAFTSDETMRYKYMLREKAIRDYYSGLDDAKQEGIEIGIAQGREQGLAQGREQGLAQGREQGLAQGREQGLAQGREQGLAQGREQGLAQGREQGLAQGREQGLAQGREQGLAQGREQGLAQGREQGVAQGVQQEKIANILGMLREGIDISIIAKITSCSAAEIQQIAHEQSQSQ